jgi:hypothetical protein
LNFSERIPTPEPRQFDALILGAGAAGLFCAALAGQRGRRVALVDHNPLPGRKILISGGGRCNFTNLHCEPSRFLSANPHFAKSALARYTPQHFLELVERHGIQWHEKTLGQLFCDGSAQQILDLLLAECERGKVDMLNPTKIVHVEHGLKGFRVETSRGVLEAPVLVVATGGLSIPKMGATGFGYELAKQFGLAVEPTRPALVPLLFNADEARLFEGLSGISTSVVATAGSRKLRGRFKEKMLITHRGLSGPAILQASSYWEPGSILEVDLAPEQNVLAALLSPKARRDLPALTQALRNPLPQRLAERIAKAAPPKGWSNPALEGYEQQLHHWQFRPDGTEGYAKAEVTAGGVSTRELDSQTMQARKMPGLFFIGEVVDVTGHLGGFNFQWAWASAHAAAQAL